MTNSHSTPGDKGFVSNDNEHATLLKALNNFKVIDPSDKEALLKGFDSIATVTRLHFHNEEKLMRRIGYQPIEPHLREHRNLLQTVATQRQRLVDSDDLAQYEIWEFLLDWITRHTNKEDLEFKTYYYKAKIENG